MNIKTRMLFYGMIHYKVLKKYCVHKSIKVYYSIGFTESVLKFWRQIRKSGGGSFIKPIQYIIFSYILFYVFN